MPNNKEKILLIRNETSLYLDDLTALVVNSALAGTLRDLSRDVEEMTPDFIVDVKQIKQLKKLTKDRLEQYGAGSIGDGELSNFVTDARKIMKGEKLSVSGGKIMSFIKEMFKGKEQKSREAQVKLEQRYEEICGKMLECQRKMANCLEECKGVSPDSMVYRKNERIYNDAKNQFAVYQKARKQLEGALDVASRARILKDYDEAQKEINSIIGVAIGNDDDLAKLIAQIEVREERNNDKIGMNMNLGDEIFNTAGLDADTNSAFGAALAAQDRRDDQLKNAAVFSGAFKSETSAEPVKEEISDFARAMEAPLADKKEE